MELQQYQTCFRPPTDTQPLQHGISTGCASTPMEKRVPVTGQQCVLEGRSPLLLFMAADCAISRLPATDQGVVLGLPASVVDVKRLITAERTNHKSNIKLSADALLKTS